MEQLSSDIYLTIIGITVIVILSFLYNAFSEKTNIPAVLLLIATGIGLNFGLNTLEIEQLNWQPILELTGIVGLIMIVLEAALDLELKAENLPVIAKSFTVALVGLVSSTAACAYILYLAVDGMDPVTAYLYATPLSILSSAIIIPSVGSLNQNKKEFHIYESTFSDILGIMQFYFVLGLIETDTSGGAAVGSFLLTLFITIAISLLASYLLVFLFQNLSSHVKLFLMISILILLYAIGKKFHLSSLIIILIFGLVLSNHHIFFRGFLKKLLQPEKMAKIEADFHVVTIESAFLVRTFFFVIFGLTISLSSLLNIEVIFISLSILVSIYLVRFLLFKLFLKQDINPQLFIAPRGLITVLLFTSIPASCQVPGFEPGILLFVIIATCLVMAGALIMNGRRQAGRLNLNDDPLVIPPEQIYKGFRSRVLIEKYGKESPGASSEE